MIYEIINPSDRVTIDAPTFEAALVATILLGGGQYAAKPVEEGAREVPLFMFGGFEAWFSEHYPGKEPKDLIEEDRAGVVATLRSACTGSVTDRKLFDAALAAITDDDKRAAFLAEWDDKKRSSLNDIANRAHLLADRLQKTDA